jgi:hypothetical protein
MHASLVLRIWLFVSCFLALWLPPVVKGAASMDEAHYSLHCCGAAADVFECLSALRAKLVSENIQCKQTSEASSFTLVTYDTTNTLQFAVYSFAVNSVFARLHNHSIFLAMPDNGFEFEKRDQRWNKVKVLETLIERQLQDGPNSDHYFVWLDSDLIFLDLNMSLSQLASQYPHAELIVSQDVDRLNGMVNTGAMIFRSGDWSLRFLRDWWTYTDRADGMDQHVFDQLYKQYESRQPSYCTNNGTTQNGRNESTSSTVASSTSHPTATNAEPPIEFISSCLHTKIVILPPHVLNSHIPARLHQQPSHRVLHLAGESSIVRAHVFQNAYAELCRAYTAYSTGGGQGSNSRGGEPYSGTVLHV